MGNPQSIELFDKYGKFVMPSAEAIATLDAETQERFRAVQEAVAVSKNATELRKVAEQNVLAALAERDNAEADLLRIRPRITATEAAKQWIRSQRAE
jgi:hypothetical protein